MCMVLKCYSYIKCQGTKIIESIPHPRTLASKKERLEGVSFPPKQTSLLKQLRYQAK